MNELDDFESLFRVAPSTRAVEEQPKDFKIERKTNMKTTPTHGLRVKVTGGQSTSTNAALKTDKDEETKESPKKEELNPLQ